MVVRSAGMYFFCCWFFFFLRYAPFSVTLVHGCPACFLCVLFTFWTPLPKMWRARLSKQENNPNLLQEVTQIHYKFWSTRQEPRGKKSTSYVFQIINCSFSPACQRHFFGFRFLTFFLFFFCSYFFPLFFPSRPSLLISVHKTKSTNISSFAFTAFKHKQKQKFSHRLEGNFISLFYLQY